MSSYEGRLRARSSPRQHGVFVALEGIDGTGKSTCCRLARLVLERELKSQWIVVHDPGKDAVGRWVRSAWRKNLTTNVRVLSLLFAASTTHATQSRKGIGDKLSRGMSVLSDRCAFSTYAYLHGKEAPLQWINSIHKGCLLPELIVYLRIPPEVAINRLAADRRQGTETVERLHEIQSKYDAAIKWAKMHMRRTRIVIIDTLAAGPPQGVAEAVAREIIAFVRDQVGSQTSQ